MTARNGVGRLGRLLPVGRARAKPADAALRPARRVPVIPLAILATLILSAALAPIISPYSPLKIDRGLNRLWNNGGIQYAPPIR